MIITDTQMIYRMVEEASEQMETIGRADWIANKKSFQVLKAQSQNYKAVYLKLDKWFDPDVFVDEAKCLDIRNATKIFFLLTLGKTCANTFFDTSEGSGPFLIEVYLYELFEMLPENNLTFGFEDDEWGVNLSQQDRMPENGIEVLAIVGYDNA